MLQRISKSLLQTYLKNATSTNFSKKLEVFHFVNYSTAFNTSQTALTVSTNEYVKHSGEMFEAVDRLEQLKSSYLITSDQGL